MDICFIGVGSIALRHIKNLRELFGEEINITALRSGKGKKISTLDDKLIDRTIYEYEEMSPHYDAVFITNPSAMHYDSLLKSIDHSDSFFIEKPVFLTGDENISFLKNKKIYVAAPLRYSRIISYLKENIDFSDVYSMRCISSSYLPEWRPDTDYRKVYSANRELGGGVSIDLIHEWDYLTYLVGFPIHVKSIISKKSELEIDSDDIAVYIAEYPSMIVELHLDYFGRKPIRKLELFMKNDTVICDFLDGSIYYSRTGKNVCFCDPRDVWQKRELRHFMKIVNREIKTDNDASTACCLLKLARGIEI